MSIHTRELFGGRLSGRTARRVLPYLVAVASVVMATLATLALGSFMEHNLLVFLLAAVLIVGLHGGAGPSSVSIGLGSLALAFFLLPPRGSLAIAGIQEVARLLLFAGLGTTIATITFVLRRSRARVAARERALRLRERQLAAARLQTLRLQIQPHFLFNALNAVSGCVRAGEDRRALEALEHLGDLLRLLLARFDVTEASLEAELQFVQLYLELQRLRLADRLEVRIDVEPDCLHARIPALVLQPLVENAFRHGIGRQLGIGQLRIRARRRGGTLRLEVIDNGPGPNGNSDASGFGVGLRTVRVRLREWSDGRSHLRLLEAPGGGACARVELPFRASHAD